MGRTVERKWLCPFGFTGFLKLHSQCPNQIDVCVTNQKNHNPNVNYSDATRFKMNAENASVNPISTHDEATKAA